MHNLPQPDGAHQNQGGFLIEIDTPALGYTPESIGNFALPETVEHIGSNALTEVDYTANGESVVPAQRLPASLEDVVDCMDHGQEWNLVAQIKKADEPVAAAALIKLIRHHTPMLRGKLFGLGANFHDQEDILSEMTMRAWNSIRHSRGLSKKEADSTAHWFVTIASNLCRDSIRKASIRPKIDPYATEADHHGYNGEDSTAALEGVLDKIVLEDILKKYNRDPEHLETIRLYYLEDRSQREIADLMEVPAGTVKSRIHYALRHLKEIAEQTE